MALERSQPGIVVPASSLVTPGGAVGPVGPVAGVYNAIGNPNFEVDQRNVGTQLVNPASGAFVIDRWTISKAGTMAVSVQQVDAGAGGVIVPGGAARISQKYLNLTLTTQQTTLTATDYLGWVGFVEGPLFRPLASGPHSISLLARSSAAVPFSFSVGLSNYPTVGPPTIGLVMLCTMTVTNAWQLFTLPNLPAFPVSVTWPTGVGVRGYRLVVSLVTGTTFIAPATGMWQTGNYVAAPGITNWAAQPVGTTFDLAFVQHEPGPICNPLANKPFDQNLRECQRYYDKSYNYGSRAGSIGVGGVASFWMGNVTNLTYAFGWYPFKQTMAVQPTMTFYDYSSGAANSVREANGSTVVAVTSAPNTGTSGFGGIGLPAAQAANNWFQGHWVADTGW